MPTSDASQPVTTSVNSPDTLPIKGYTFDQLAAYIYRQLGAPTWTVELTKQQILDCIQDALSMYSTWVPIPRPMSIQLVRDKYSYLQGVDVGQGVANVSFVEQTPAPTEIFYGNLISPAPIMRTGLDEYDTFLRWRKTWMRVTSIQPDWYYDEMAQALYIHNPLERYHCGVICYFPHTDTRSLNVVGADWVKRYALAKARFLLGEVWMKFSGAIPGPIKDVQLDQGKRADAKVDIQALETSLKGMMTAAGVWID